MRRWYRSSLETLTLHRRTVDALNVFPVPDGDTGTNLVATLTAACEALDELGDNASLPEVTHRAARGALLGARGNSGVILAQMLRGLADTWGVDTVDSRGLAAGLRQACHAANDAVAAPAEGTILTVARAAAEAAENHANTPLPQACEAISRAAAAAVSATVDQLPALARAGVVDAGGLGLALMLDVLVAVTGGTTTGAALRAADTASRTARLRTAVQVPRESGSEEYAYEVQYLLDAETDAVDRLRTILSGLGDSLVIVGAASAEPGSGSAAAELRTWNVHVHVNDIGAAIEAGIESGRVYRLSVTRFADQVAAGGEVAVESPSGQRGVVVIAEGSGLAQVLRGEGALPVSGGRPSTQEVLGACRSSGGSDVIVLADESSHAVAESAAALARADGFRVAVIPTRSPVQALAALAVRDPGRRFDDDVIAMAEAAGGCRHAEVTIAARDALTSVGKCERGDFLGLADGDVVLIGADLEKLLIELTGRLCSAGAELLTIVAGSGLESQVLDNVAANLTRQWPLVDVQCLDGGQSRHLVLIGAE
nr:DAK2 domain-containing protein [Stackebrandtia nassauensis]